MTTLPCFALLLEPGSSYRMGNGVNVRVGPISGGGQGSRVRQSRPAPFVHSHFHDPETKVKLFTD